MRPPDSDGSSDEASGTSEGAPRHDKCVSEDELVDQVYRELNEKRAAWLAQAPADIVDFRCTILGGAWTKLHSGKACDYVMGKAATKEVDQWCRRYSMAVSARFSIAMYSERIGSVLAREWCRKMQHYYDIAVASEGSMHRFTEAEHASYQESGEFSLIVAGLDGKALERAHWLRALRPTAPSHPA